MSVGGFLRGRKDGKSNESAVVACCCHGLDVFIGDRGSGKSTFLKLFSLLKDCLRKNTKFTNALEWQRENDEEQEIQWNRKIAEFLTKHDVKKYACYFYRDNDLWSFYAEITEEKRAERNNTGIYALFRYDDTEKTWISVEEIESIRGQNYSRFFPNMKVFNQGEISRIAQEGEDKALNMILAQDNLYPAFETQYKMLDKLGRQLSTYSPNSLDFFPTALIKFDAKIIREFIKKTQEGIEFLENLT